MAVEELGLHEWRTGTRRVWADNYAMRSPKVGRKTAQESASVLKPHTERQAGDPIHLSATFRLAGRVTSLPEQILESGQRARGLQLLGRVSASPDLLCKGSETCNIAR